MSKFSNYLENSILNLICQGTTITGTTNYVALYTSDPTDANSGTEASYGSYARVAVTSLFPSASGTAGSVSNSSDIIFPQATSGSNVITHIGIIDNSSGGNLLMYGTLTASKTITTGDIPKFLANSLTLTVA